MFEVWKIHLFYCPLRLEMEMIGWISLVLGNLWILGTQIFETYPSQGSPGFSISCFRKIRRIMMYYSMRNLTSLLPPAATLHTRRRVVGSRSFMASRGCSMNLYCIWFLEVLFRLSMGSLDLYLDILIPA